MIFETPWPKPSVEECLFYSTMAYPSGFQSVGEWEIGEHLNRYTGKQDWQDKSVLEIGPASGQITFYLESRGASVTAVDVAPGKTWELLPFVGVNYDHEAWLNALMMFKKSFWFGYHEFNSQSQVAYCDVYHPPDDLGTYTHGLFCAVLLHLSRPFDALRAMAEHVTDTIVVSDMHRPLVVGMEFAPALATPSNACAWWYVPHAQVSRMLQVLGFETVSLDVFTLKSTRHNELSAFYTLVARRCT